MSVTVNVGLTVNVGVTANVGVTIGVGIGNTASLAGIVPAVIPTGVSVRVLTH